MTVTPQLLDALIAADERALWWLGEEPKDPDWRQRWRDHREQLERELARFQQLRAQRPTGERG